jgi:two-component system, LytTR family, response regulator
MTSASPKLRTLLVDDEPLARRGLQLRLANETDIDVVAECANGHEAVAAIAEHGPDLMFLDVQMPGLDGFATLRTIPASQMPMVVFVTAYDHYAIRAFEASAVDYVLKPIDDSRLQQALFRVRQQYRERNADMHCARLLNLLGEVSGRPSLTLEEALVGVVAPGSGGTRLVFKDGNRTVRVEPDSVRWIDAAGDYMCIHTDAETLVVRATLSELERQLDTRRFARIHRSTIVNVGRVREMRSHINGEYFLVLDSGNELKLSRTYKDKVTLLRQ